MEFSFSFPKEDSNPHKQNQNLRCYHYTIGECNARLTYSFALFLSSTLSNLCALSGKTTIVGT